MDFPIINLCRIEEFEDSSTVIPGLKPLKWSAEELRNRLNQASLKLEQSLERQRVYKKKIQSTVDRIMTYHSELSECESERQEIIEKISQLRLSKATQEIQIDVRSVLCELVRHVSREANHANCDVADILSVNDDVTEIKPKNCGIIESDAANIKKTPKEGDVTLVSTTEGDGDRQGDFKEEENKKSEMK